MKKHVNNVIYYSFVPLCIHVLVCILTPVYQSFCPSKFAENFYQATLSKSILKKISTRVTFVIIEDLHIKTRAESKRAQFNYFPVENSNHRKKLSTFNDNKISRICVILWEAVEDVTVMFTYFVALPLLPKNLTQNSVIIVCPTFSFLISLTGHFIQKSGLLTILNC